MKELDEKYMQRCLEIAKKGLGTTWPNPMVGSVIVYKDRIIGEGYTSPYGGPHAEVNAINTVKDTDILKAATLYVTLEPCSHHGKTPPCSDLIIRHRIPRVVIGTADPHSKVAGKGIAKLKAAGCEIVLGILEEACKAHHNRFLTYHLKKRPYIILKWAQTADGFLAPDAKKRKASPEPYWITTKIAQQRVHQWRSDEQAILVGTHTVLTDNPKLNVRSWKGTSPTRVILDRKLKITPAYHVLDKSIPTIVLTEITDTTTYHSGVTYAVIDYTKDLAKEICDALYKLQLVSIIIEGGAKTLDTFITEQLWDEARVFTGKTDFESGVKAPVLQNKAVMTECIATDTLTTYIND